MILDENEKQKITENILEDLVIRLNYNYEIIRSTNKNILKPDLVIDLTLYKVGNYWSEENLRIRGLILDKMMEIEKKTNPLAISELIEDYFVQLLDDLRKNKIKIGLGDLDRLFYGDYTREFRCYSGYIEKYIIFNPETETFALIPDYKSQIKEYITNQTKNLKGE